MLSTTQLQIFSIGIACGLVIAAYGTFRCKTTDFKDPMTKSLFGEPWNRFLDGWGISHFLFFLMLAYHWPTEWAFIFGTGVFWELLEWIFKAHPFYLSKCNYTIDTEKGEGWWYGRWQDLIMNGLGVALGSWLGSR